MQYYQPNGYYRSSSNVDDRGGLLLPLLLGAAVGFPVGYFASNTNKNNQYPYYPMYPPYPIQPMPYPISPYPYMPY